MTKDKPFEEGTELQTIESSYPIIAAGGELSEALKENLGNDSIGRFDLSTITVPLGGGELWMIPDFSGEPAPTEEFVGIIIHHNIERNYWERGFDGSGTIPDCTSSDTITGVGNPGGDCNTCEFAEFGSAKVGDGQACRVGRVLFILRPGMMLPWVVSVPPSSLKNCKDYLMNLGNFGIPFYKVVTSFTLESGQQSARIKFRVVREQQMKESDIASVKGFSSKFISDLEKQGRRFKGDN